MHRLSAYTSISVSNFETASGEFRSVCNVSNEDGRSSLLLDIPLSAMSLVYSFALTSIAACNLVPVGVGDI